ncbi:polysaccharide deacetylase family protein [Flavilitoribacter nigricans]|uniref:Polysaccharide deacetylase family protein n=1 Tax=Flavilitoribacter nigricans (strain ATCC 23147 / DSM 23189 / NBRC 102662 / NCIMB 1420 / SS-2) TaxID=1122177 RepID=A0A2D0N1H4_FLAN2|nr:polysaccharide deacetylase family protein [Flavilitoribacter nigricans]PHN02307.1 polysaccharide deacetylase family protein [Flavilitoribacter nigricans DSM 23189 = NBRC 102662]
MYLIKTPQFIQDLFPNFTWRIPGKEKIVYLTFDDGPIPEVTPWVLEQLEAYNAHATFFCVGENIHRHPEVFQQVVEAGHAVGNHTNQHLNGWSVDNLTYFHDIRHCARAVKTTLFRPPYGRMKPKQAQFLQRHYRIVMWDVLSGDFDPNISNEQCLDNVISNVNPGSIVVFHDSLKAQEKLEYVLPRVLEHFKNQGYEFHALSTSEEEQQVNLRKSA